MDMCNKGANRVQVERQVEQVDDQIGKKSNRRGCI